MEGEKPAVLIIHNGVATYFSNYLFCVCMSGRNFTRETLRSTDNRSVHRKNISFLAQTRTAIVVTAITAKRGRIKRLLMSRRNFIGCSAFYGPIAAHRSSVLQRL